MADTTSINLRIDKELKTQAEELFSNIGMNMTTAVNIFLKQAVRDQGIPFHVTAVSEYNACPVYTGQYDLYSNYEEYIAESLRAADSKAADGKMKYYTAEQIRNGLEKILDEKV